MPSAPPPLCSGDSGGRTPHHRGVTRNSEWLENGGLRVEWKYSETETTLGQMWLESLRQASHRRGESTRIHHGLPLVNRSYHTLSIPEKEMTGY